MHDHRGEGEVLGWYANSHGQHISSPRECAVIRRVREEKVLVVCILAPRELGELQRATHRERNILPVTTVLVDYQKPVLVAKYPPKSTAVIDLRRVGRRNG